jgi:hypothetical protein
MVTSLEELERQAREIGRVLKRVLDGTFGARAVGFALLLFDYGEGGHMTYVSSADRQDMIKALEEALGHLRAGTDSPPVPPAGTRH